MNAVFATLMEKEGLTFPEAVEKLARAGGMMDKKMESLKAHPLAEAYRLMREDELADLAASIKEIGLLDPITIGVVDGKRWIVDGRNRAKACEIAGVEPEYEEIKFNTEDDLRGFIAGRSERRNLTAGQKAIGFALLFPEPERGGRGRKTIDSVKGFDPALKSRARAVLAHSRALAESVLRGTTPLNEAYEQVRAEKQRGQSDEARGLELATEAPDLAALVKDEQMKLNEAYAAMLERKRQRQTAIEQAKFAAESGLAQFSRTILTITLGASVTDEQLVSASRFAEITEAYETLKSLVTGKGGEQ